MCGSSPSNGKCIGLCVNGGPNADEPYMNGGGGPMWGIISVQVGGQPRRLFCRGQHYVPRYLCSPVPMFPEPMFPGTCVPRYLCSPVPMFPEPMFPGTYVPRYLCSPNLYSPVPMFPDLLQMCCREYIRRPSDRHWNCRAAKRNISQNVKT